MGGGVTFLMYRVHGLSLEALSLEEHQVEPVDLPSAEPILGTCLRKYAYFLKFFCVGAPSDN